MGADSEWVVVVDPLPPDEAKALFDTWLATREDPLDPNDIRVDLLCGRPAVDARRRYSVRTSAL
jgi:hypothetical protein